MRLISIDQVARIKRMLGSGFSHRATARQCGVSRHSVGRIANGKWDEQQRTLTERRAGNDRYQIVAPHRCAGCGGRIVTKHCLLCELRKNTLKQALEEVAL